MSAPSRVAPSRVGVGIAIAIATLGAACEREAPVDPCTTRLDGIAAHLERAARAADPPDAPPDVALPVVRQVRAPATPPPVMVSVGEEVFFEGRGAGGLDDPARTGQTLARDLRARQTWADGATPLVALWVEPSVPLATLVTLLAHAPPELRFVLYARGPALEGPPASAWVDARLDAPVPSLSEAELLDPARSAITPIARRRMRLAAAWEPATRACPAAREAFSIEAEAPPSAASVGALIGALRECGCARADLTAIAYVAFEALRDEAGPLVVLAPLLRFGAATGDGEELTFGGDDDAQDLAARLAGRDAQLTWIRVD